MRIPGQRSALKLLRAAVPSRQSVMVAICAGCVSLGLYVVAHFLVKLGGPATLVGNKLHQYAVMFEGMPLWVILGGCVFQVGTEGLVVFDMVRGLLFPKE